MSQGAAGKEDRLPVTDPRPPLLPRDVLPAPPAKPVTSLAKTALASERGNKSTRGAAALSYKQILLAEKSKPTKLCSQSAERLTVKAATKGPSALGASSERDIKPLKPEQQSDEQIVLERSEPMFLCDQSAVRVMVRAVTEGPSALGAWVQQQLEAGRLWVCSEVDVGAVHGWKAFAPDPDYGTPRFVKCLFEKRASWGCDIVAEPALYDTVATYLRLHSRVKDLLVDIRRFQLVTGNRAFGRMFHGDEKKKAEIGFWYAFPIAAGPVVLFVDNVHQVMPFQVAGRVA